MSLPFLSSLAVVLNLLTLWPLNTVLGVVVTPNHYFHCYFIVKILLLLWIPMQVSVLSDGVRQPLEKGHLNLKNHALESFWISWIWAPSPPWPSVAVKFQLRSSHQLSVPTLLPDSTKIHSDYPNQTIQKNTYVSRFLIITSMCSLSPCKLAGSLVLGGDLWKYWEEYYLALYASPLLNWNLPFEGH